MDKRCSNCRQTLPLTAFSRDRYRGDGRQPWCRECQRRHRIVYKLSAEEYDGILARQGGHCATCPAVPTAGKRLHVDHCHRTGRVRGLLCGPCNRALGMVEDSPHRLVALQLYLNKHDDRPMRMPWEDARAG